MKEIGQKKPSVSAQNRRAIIRMPLITDKENSDCSFLYFLGYSEFPSWLAWQPIQIVQYPNSIQQNIKMWVMVWILVIQ